MMKRISGLIASQLFISILALVIKLPVYADDNWDDSIYRAYYEEGQLTEEQRLSLHETAVAFVQKWNIDMALVVTNSSGYTGSFEDAVIAFYTNNEFGYGPNRDGIIACYEEDKNQMLIRTFGGAKEIFTQEFIDENEAYLPKFHINNGNYGPLYAFYLVAENYMVDLYGNSSEDGTKAEMGEQDINQEIAQTEGEQVEEALEGDVSGLERDDYGLPIRNNTGEKPTWYPEVVKAFQFYHDSVPSRVVDVADIFTDAEELVLKEKIAEVTEKTGKDIVIFTDTNTYGLDRETYCYDFYDFCGYGFGETYDGMCLFVCMDPNNRGWVASATGVVEDMYTEDIANEMDDQLYEFMAAGNYGDGVYDWICNMYNLYTEGYPFVADWLPKKAERDSFVRTNNSETSRFYDPEGILQVGRLPVIEDKAKAISDKYGIDVAVNTTKHTYGMSDEEYADAYYYYNGLGFGENYDGILLTIINGYNSRAVVTAYGAGRDKLTDLNFERLVEQVQSSLEDESPFSAVDRFVKDVGHLERTGRVNRTFGQWFLRILAACGAGGIFGGVSLARAKSKMQTVHSAYNADAYMDGTRNIIPICDEFVDEKVTRTKIVRTVTRSDSSSSSGPTRSTYHSHSTGSSGRSHTSSSRNF
jgi:uncharacterized membrane protein YgcG